MPGSTTIHICAPSDTSAVLRFQALLINRLRDRYGGHVTCVKVTSDEGTASNTPLLLLCHNHSRIGADIDAAITVIRGGYKASIAVLVIHVKEPHALPVTNPTDNLYDDKYEAFGRLIDFAFTPSAGIYDCRMNREGDGKLTAFLQAQFQKPSDVPVSRPLLQPEDHSLEAVITHGSAIHICASSDTPAVLRFQDLLINRLRDRHGHVTCVKVASDEGTASNTPLLLLCHNHSRIGADIDAAITVIRGSHKANIAVLVIHVKEPHALPLTNPTDNLYDEKYEAFGRLIDFAFTPSAGIYHCRMNQDGERKLNQFLQKYVGAPTRRPADQPWTRWRNTYTNSTSTQRTTLPCAGQQLFFIIVVGIGVVTVVVLFATLL